jgi:hypothetical protein
MRKNSDHISPLHWKPPCWCWLGLGGIGSVLCFTEAFLPENEQAWVQPDSQSLQIICVTDRLIIHKLLFHLFMEHRWTYSCLIWSDFSLGAEEIFNTYMLWAFLFWWHYCGRQSHPLPTTCKCSPFASASKGLRYSFIYRVVIHTHTPAHLPTYLQGICSGTPSKCLKPNLTYIIFSYRNILMMMLNL